MSYNPEKSTTFYMVKREDLYEKYFTIEAGKISPTRYSSDGFSTLCRDFDEAEKIAEYAANKYNNPFVVIKVNLTGLVKFKTLKVEREEL
jgi:uncharacterized protein YifE (UPF0438 family)